MAKRVTSRNTNKLIPDSEPVEPQTSNTPHEEKQNIIVKILQPKSKHPAIANVISGISAAISLCLGVITLFLFLQTRKQATSADDAAHTAQNTLKEIKRFDSTTIANQQASDKKADDSARVKSQRERDAFNLQKSFYEAQNQYFKASQKEFETNYKPFLQARLLYVSPLIAGNPVDIAIQFENMGNFTAQIVYTQIAGSTRVSSPNFDIFKGEKYKQIDNRYIPKNDTSLRDESFGIIPVLGQHQLESLKTGKYFLYLWGVVKYQDLASKNFRFYRYIVKVRFTSSESDFQYAFNDNTDLK